MEILIQQNNALQAEIDKLKEEEFTFQQERDK